MIRNIVPRLADFPGIFDLLRWILEGGYRGHAGIIRRERLADYESILDCGCGTGVFAQHFAPRNYIGIDVNMGYVAAASKKFPAYRFFPMDARQLAFDAETFDACFVAGVFHHLSDEIAREVLSEISRVLKRSGKLVIWEDIAARDPFNLVGHLIHHLDLGRHIRQPEDYRSLFNEFVNVEDQYFMRSGFMDYCVFRCGKPK
ncbi:MAG: class I SAM-dependent methyltransferase [Planctomycetia bacterium]|nr:class I SAM-dependent methyltransferase [Planctomycetia bacterium]